MSEAEFNPVAVAGHNQPPKEAAFAKINDLYDEVKNWCDGEPLQHEKQAEAIEAIIEQLKAAGAEAETLRVAAKKPHDEAAKAVQDEFNPYVQKDKGKVDKGKKLLLELLTPWRLKVAEEKAKEARRIAQAAADAQAEAEAAMRASRGNVEARDEAEEIASEAKDLQKDAKRAARQADRGLGLVTRTTVTVDRKNLDAALDWAFDYQPERFYELAAEMAEEHVKINKLEKMAGFVITKEKVARA